MGREDVEMAQRVPTSDEVLGELVHNLGQFFGGNVELLGRERVGPRGEQEVATLRVKHQGVSHQVQTVLGTKIIAAIQGRMWEEAASIACAVTGLPLEELSPELWDAKAEEGLRVQERQQELLGREEAEKSRGRAPRPMPEGVTMTEDGSVPAPPSEEVTRERIEVSDASSGKSKPRGKGR